jgi:hypothetical protein
VHVAPPQLEEQISPPRKLKDEVMIIGIERDKGGAAG